MRRPSDEELESLWAEVRRARESEIELLNAVTAALLHLMVRPEQRLRGADDNVREILLLARNKAEGLK